MNSENACDSSARHVSDLHKAKFDPFCGFVEFGNLHIVFARHSSVKINFAVRRLHYSIKPQNGSNFALCKSET